MSAPTLLDRAYDSFLSKRTRERAEKSILIVAIVGFLIHLLLIVLADFGLIPIGENSQLLSNPIAATYTPFSFIIVYEVYMLVYYLPRSITTYIAKQYEIITLIIIRRLFKDLGNLEITTDWFQVRGDLQFTYDLIASLILFFLLYHFVIRGKQFAPETRATDPLPENLIRFIRFKKGLAVILIPLLLVLAAYTLITWTVGTLYPASGFQLSFKNLNSIFFDQFFTVLIVVDVILLLSSFFLTKRFHKVIRNSGFIVSTILIRISFSTEGLMNVILIVTAVTFGLLILIIHNLYEQKPAYFDNEEGVA